MVAQIAGGIAGTFVAHLMFELPLIEASLTERLESRSGLPKPSRPLAWSRPFLAASIRRAPSVPWLVGLYITAAYWFTASTSFANPAVAIARSLTNTFSGIRPIDLPGFIVAELVGAVIGLLLDGLAAARTPGRRTLKNETLAT